MSYRQITSYCVQCDMCHGGSFLEAPTPLGAEVTALAHGWSVNDRGEHRCPGCLEYTREDARADLLCDTPPFSVGIW